jgi:hypothetical protein
MKAITHIGGTQFRVPSASGGEDYVVDIAENNGNFACLCTDFRTRCQQNWDAGRTVVEYSPASKGRTRCKHCHALLLHLGNMMAARLSSTLANGA